MSTNKTGRNDPCPCGSGKKYKQCCQQQETRTLNADAMRAAIPNELRMAAAQLHAGHWQQAEQICRKILQIMPSQPDALGMLGSVALQDGNVISAIELLDKAVKGNPCNPELHSNLGFAYHESGKPDLAASHYRKALSIHSNYVNAHYNLHALLIDTGELGSAQQHLRKALALNPHDRDASFMLGVLLDYLDDYAAATEVLAPLKGGSGLDQARLDAWAYLKSSTNPLPAICGSMLRTFEKAFAAAPTHGLVLEFGVRHGNTIRQIAALAKQAVHGFDSFEGLPEAWHNESKGSYSTRGILPAVPKNVTLHAGWFEDTLPKFLQQHDGPVRLLNIDCDIYSSTKTVLDHLASRIVPGSVIIFDEYIGNEHWREDEYKAFQEAVACYGWRYEYLCFSVFTKQVAVRITAVD